MKKRHKIPRGTMRERERVTSLSSLVYTIIKSGHFLCYLFHDKRKTKCRRRKERERKEGEKKRESLKKFIATD